MMMMMMMMIKNLRVLYVWNCFTGLPRPDRLWGPPSLLFNGYRGIGNAAGT